MVEITAAMEHLHAQVGQGSLERGSPALLGTRGGIIPSEVSWWAAEAAEGQARMEQLEVQATELRAALCQARQRLEPWGQGDHGAHSVVSPMGGSPQQGIQAGHFSGVAQVRDLQAQASLEQIRGLEAQVRPALYVEYHYGLKCS